MTENNYKLINMEDIEAEDVEWLWEGFIPVGKLTILQGDPGKGNPADPVPSPEVSGWSQHR